MKTALRRNHPARADVLYLEAGRALRSAAGCPKRGASAAGVSVELARRWFNGDASNPIGRALELQQSLPGPFAIASLFTTRAIRTLLPMDDAQLIARFFTLLREATRAEAEQIARKVALAERRDLAGLRDASERESAMDQELAAVCAELLERGLDPWQGRAGAA